MQYKNRNRRESVGLRVLQGREEMVSHVWNPWSCTYLKVLWWRCIVAISWTGLELLCCCHSLLVLLWTDCVLGAVIWGETWEGSV